MKPWAIAALVLVLATATLPVAATAATVEIFSQEVRVQSTAARAALIITDF